MASNTTRAGLIKPTTLEPRAVGPLNTNADRTDELLGAFLINDGASIPDAQAMDGMIVKEKTSGKVWVLQKNVGGTFDRKYIRYPWSFSAFSSAIATGSGSWQNYGFLSYGGSSGPGGVGYGPVNSSAADLVGTRLVLPVTGIYNLVAVAKFASNSTGVRGLNFELSTTIPQTAPNEDINTGMILSAASGAQTQIRCQALEQFPAGQIVTLNSFQNSGVALTCTFVIFATLIAVTG